MAALHSLAEERYPHHTLIIGIDANTWPGAGGGDGGGRLSVGGFAGLLAGRGLGSCWDGEDLAGVWTTFSARTPLQPQLHKAVGPAAASDPRHRRLRDWIVFRRDQIAIAAGAGCGGVRRDNTGRGELAEMRAMATPSAAFPSDHAIVAATLCRCGESTADGVCAAGA